MSTKLTFLFLSSLAIFMPGKSHKLVSTFIVVLTLSFLMFLSTAYTPMPKLNALSNIFYSDLMSSSLILLTIYLVILCYIVSSSIFLSTKHNAYTISLMTLTLVLVLCFSFKNIFWFYIAFEFALIPTILLIIGWGYQEERFQASFYLIMFTMTTSLPMLIALIMISNNNSPSFSLISNSINMVNSTSSHTLLWAGLITVFMVKLPIYLFHLWLPKAHVEAPVVGSMLLAGILLKLGGYGFMRFGTVLVFNTSLLSNILATISIWGAVLTALICTTQIDMKALIAYSSITHMSLMMLAISSSNMWGWQSALTIMISHGLCSSGLFSMAGTLYDFTATRNLFLNKGLLIIFPALMMWFFILAAFNFGAPPSMNMMGELMAITASIAMTHFTSMGLMIMLIVAGWYSITLYMTLSHGQLPSLFNPMMNMSPRTYLILLGHLMPLSIYLLQPSLVLEWT